MALVNFLVSDLPMGVHMSQWLSVFKIKKIERERETLPGALPVSGGFPMRRKMWPETAG